MIGKFKRNLCCYWIFDDHYDAKIIADYTGGTKSMCAGLVMAAMEYENIELQYIRFAVKQAQFIFSITPRKAQTDESEKKRQDVQLEAVFEALKQALEWLGAGAKTGAGYGYMTREGDFAKDMGNALDKENMSEQQLEIVALNNSFQQNKTNNIKEAVGGRLYTQLNTLIKKAKDDATEPVWSDQDKKDLQKLGTELLKFVGANNKKIKEVLDGLPQED